LWFLKFRSKGNQPDLLFVIYGDGPKQIDHKGNRMSGYDWSKFSARIDVRSSVENVYAAWTTRVGLEQWFLRVAEFTMPNGGMRDHAAAIQTGDRYRWLWHGYDDTTVEHGVIEETNGRDSLRFTFAGSCLVSVHVTVEEGLTLVELRQENIALDEASRVNYHLGCITGWTFYLANLKSILEGGIDLRNKNEKLHKLVNS
jgi:uncharacterized protein YndB with AHSA1/START domain